MAVIVCSNYTELERGLYVSPEQLLARAGERVVQCSFTLACCVSGGFGAERG